MIVPAQYLLCSINASDECNSTATMTTVSHYTLRNDVLCNAAALCDTTFFFSKIADRITYHARLACVAGGISRASAFVLVAKTWTKVAKPWEDWWRVELNSRLPKFVGFFELCVHQYTRILDWLRVLKRQSNVNRYILSFQGKRFVFIHKFANGECGEMLRGSFRFSEYPQVEQKNYTKGRTGKSR